MSPRADAKLWKRTIRVARHEAGHAVMAELCGHHVERVRLTKAGGHCDHSCDENSVDPLQLGMITVAGHAADVLWNRTSRTTAPMDDHKFLVRMGFRDRSFPTLLGLAMGALYEEQDAVFAVAKALKQRNLTGDEVRQIINATKQNGVSHGKPSRKNQRSS